MVVALAAGVALVASIDLVNRVVLRAFAEIVDTMAGRAALQVGAGEGGLLPEELATTISGVSGVELAVPVVSATAFTDDESGELLTVHGVDIGNDAAVRVYDAQGVDGLELEDPLIFLSQPDSIMLTRAFAQRRDLSIGDRINLVTPAGSRPFVIRGLLAPHGIAKIYGGSLVVMDVLAAERAFTRPGFVNRIDVVVRRDADVANVASSVQSTLPTGLHVQVPAQRRIEIMKVVSSMQGLLQGMALVSLIGAFLVAFNRLSTVFERRMWQLGMMRAVGARRSVIVFELLKESALLGLVGVGIGIPAGIALGRVLLPVIATTTALNSKLIAPDAVFHIDIRSLMLAGGLGMGASVSAAIVPAWRAARSALAEVIRLAGREPESRRSRWRIIALSGLMATLAVCVVMQGVTRSAVWGLVATGVIGAAAAVVARPFVNAAERPLAAVLRSLPGVTGLFAARTLARQPRRAALTVGMLSVGLGSVVWLWTVAHSFECSLIDTLGHAFRADLILSSSHLASGFDDAPMQGDVAEESRDIPGVESAIGERIVDWEYAGGPIALDAFDPLYFTSGKFGRWKLLGESIHDVWDKVARGEAVLASTSFVRNVHASLGDSIVIDTPGGGLRVVIGGITSAFASPRGTLEMSRDLYRRYWNDEQITRAHLHLAPGTDPVVLKEAIARRFRGRYRLRVLSAGELLLYWSDQVRRAFTGLHAVGGLVLVVILVGLADTLAAGVLERRRELGIIRAVGGRKRILGRIVVGEAVMLGLMGLVLALVAGIGLGYLWIELTLPLLLGWALEFHVPVLAIYGIAIMTGIVSVVAALAPAGQAAGVSPAVALRYE